MAILIVKFCPVCGKPPASADVEYQFKCMNRKCVQFDIPFEVCIDDAEDEYIDDDDDDEDGDLG